MDFDFDSLNLSAIVVPTNEGPDQKGSGTPPLLDYSLGGFDRTVDIERAVQKEFEEAIANFSDTSSDKKRALLEEELERVCTDISHHHVPEYSFGANDLLEGLSRTIIQLDETEDSNQREDNERRKEDSNRREDDERRKEERDLLAKMVIEGMRNMKPSQRRMLMAFGSPFIPRQRFETLIGDKISSREWAAANKHAKFPGAGIPQETVDSHYRKRASDQTLGDFLQWLYASDLLQHLAFGQKVIKQSSGKFICIEAVDRTKTTNAIVKEYFRTFLQDQGEVDIDFCEKKNRKSNTQCVLKKGHGGRHAYIPKDGSMLSPSLVEKIVNELTAGEMKSLAGLDNTYVECGRENFENMLAWIDTLQSFNEVGGTQISNTEFSSLACRIKEAETFHQAGFAQHLGQGDYSCACFECGFSAKCSKHDNNIHKGPCGDCYESFRIFDDMHELHSRVRHALSEKDFFVKSPAVEDDMNVMLDDLKEFVRLLLKYREHVAQREDEAIFDSQFFSSLKEGEVVVVLDYKMKILSSFFREKQEDWFAKRGFSCLGALLYFGSSSDKDANEVEYHFFLSSDTTQDCDAVNIVKDIIYNIILPKYGIKAVHFRADGAKNFVGNKVKAIISHWGIEKSFKTTVPGCGKTSLDGMFGIISQFLAKVNNAGMSFRNAEELWNILDNSGLNFSYFHLFKPARAKMMQFEFDEKQIKKMSLGSNYYLLRREDNGEIYGHHHSRHGDGVRLKALESKRNDSFDQELYAQELLNTHMVKSILLTNPEALQENRRSLYQKKKWRERKNEKRIEFVNGKNGKLDEEWEVKCESLKKIGLYMCDAQNHQTGHHCTALFNSEANLNRHKEKGCHSFPNESLLTSIVNDARSGKYSLCLDSGTRINRDRSIASEYNQKEGPGKDFNYNTTAISKEKCFGRGCYHKKNQATEKQKFNPSGALLNDLETMFKHGEDRTDSIEKSKASKYTAEQALVELKNKKSENGRRFYGPECEGGSLPTLTYVKGWFSNRSREGGFEFSDRLISALEEIVQDDETDLSAKKVRNKLKLMRSNDGEYLFDPKDLPKEKHIKMWIDKRREDE